MQNLDTVDMAWEGTESKGWVWRTSEIGELLYYSPNTIAELPKNGSSDPVCPPATPQILLLLSSCKTCHSSLLEGPLW